MVRSALRIPAFAFLGALALLVGGPTRAIAAPPAPPAIGVGTSFELMVSKLDRAGFSPAIVPPYEVCEDEACEGYRPLDCSAQKYCTWLFERRADLGLYVVETGPVRRRDGRYRHHAFLKLRAATLKDLERQYMDLSWRDGAYRRVAPPTPKPEPPAPIPLCSEAHVMPCWIKPPPDEPPRPGKR